MDDTAFTREINDQSSALMTVTDYYRSVAGNKILEQAIEAIRYTGKIIFTGMGTSLHVALSVRNEVVLCIPSCEIWDAGELFHFGLRTVRENTIVVAISQSGESAETRAVVRALADKNMIIGLVNVSDSTIGNYADITLPIKGGAEVSISNKTYTNTLAVLLIIADRLSNIAPETTFKNLYDVAKSMKKSLANSERQAAQAAQFFKGMTSFHIIARGRDLTTAEQWSLIMKEAASLAAQGSSSGLFRHGPIEMGGPDLSLACLVSEDTKPELTISLGEELADMGSRVLVIGDQFYDTTLEQIVITSPSSRYFPISCAPFIELFVHKVAKQLGRTAGVFTHAVKVTDRE
ncbi:SIS domain-containing protein [Candidatus Latescibacterota bacterium]